MKAESLSFYFILSVVCPHLRLYPLRALLLLSLIECIL